MRLVERWVLFLFILAGVGGMFFYSTGTEELDITPSPPDSLVKGSLVPEEFEELLPVYSSPILSARAYKEALTTQFWVGEDAGPENGFIANDDSYWDTRWVEHFGGVDNPECRDDFYPCDFVPKENPFYVALPYGEFRGGGRTLKDSARDIPWFSLEHEEPLLKNRWVEVVFKDTTCYGQWEDVGPFLTDDFEYVFGNEAPSNEDGVGAGLDVSPALWDCLGLRTNTTTSWRFVSEAEVPPGPWKEIVTTYPGN
jgi:hypothetical protein